MRTLREVFVSLKKQTLTVGLVLAVVIAIPLIVWSYSSDPPLGKTGAPGEGTCADCHSGYSGGGSITITSSAGTHYHPGTKQHLTVTISDPVGLAVAWGYEMTAVKNSRPSVGAGNFKATDNNSNVRKSGTKSYAAQINDQYGKTTQVTYKIDWIPPKTNVGKITLYTSGLGDTDANPPNTSSVYKSRLTLTPQ